MSYASIYLFLLGFAAGITILTLTAYRRISPRWLRYLLIATGFFIASRYVTMAFFTHPDAPQRFWMLHYCWLASFVGIPLFSVFALDQLIRHPAMSPKKLLLWFSPFLIVYAIIIVFGAFVAAPDPVIGWTLNLTSGWQWVLVATQSLFIAGFIGFCILLIRKIPLFTIRISLFLLMAGQMYLAIDGVLVTIGVWYFRPYLFSELIMLLVLWHTYETAARLQQSSLSL